MTQTSGKIKQWLFSGAVVSVCLAALAVSLSTSLLGILSGLAVLGWLLAGGPAMLPSVFRRNPSTLVALILFTFMILAIAYSPASGNEALSTLKKYRELALLPVVFCLLSRSARYRNMTIAFFLAGCITLMLVSYLMFFDLFKGERYGYSLVFHITHSFFMAILAYWSLHNSMTRGIKRYFWAVIFLAAVINLFYIAPGRTGMFVFCCLMLLFLYQRLSLTRWVASMLVLIALLAGAFYTSDNFSSRIGEAVDEIRTYRPGQSKTSIGQRFDWWRTSIELIKEKPLVGYGTGSYRVVHQESIRHTKITPTDNPHNEFLFLGVQFGLIGIALFCVLIVLQLYESRTLPQSRRYLFQGVVLALLTGSLMNSLLFDSQQGHCYLLMSAALLSGSD